MRVVIAEDSVLVREGLARLLGETGIEVAAAVGDAESFLRAVDAEQPDAVVVDVRLPPTFSDEGLRAALVVRQSWPRTGVLVLSQYVEERYAAELLSGNRDPEAGVGYLLRTGSATSLSSWTPCTGSPAGAASSIPRSSASS